MNVSTAISHVFVDGNEKERIVFKIPLITCNNVFGKTPFDFVFKNTAYTKMKKNDNKKLVLYHGKPLNFSQSHRRLFFELLNLSVAPFDLERSN